jgi:hypothetical protein
MVPRMLDPRPSPLAVWSYDVPRGGIRQYRGSMGVEGEARRTRGDGQHAARQRQVEALGMRRDAVHGDAQRADVPIHHREVPQVEAVQGHTGGRPPVAGGLGPGRRLSAGRCRVRRRSDGRRRRQPLPRLLVQAPVGPPADARRRHVDPDARQVPGSPAEQEARSLQRARKPGELQSQVAVGAGLQVTVSNCRQALDHGDGPSGQPGAGRVPVQQAHPRVAAGALGLGRVGDAGRHVERAAVVAHVRREREGDRLPRASHGGELDGDRALEERQELPRPAGGVVPQRRSERLRLGDHGFFTWVGVGWRDSGAGRSGTGHEQSMRAAVCREV